MGSGLSHVAEVPASINFRKSIQAKIRTERNESTL